MINKDNSTYLVKIDLSGIQQFIFDVPSKGAARELKGRSFYVIALSEICREFLQQHLNQAFEVVYSGGGNTFAYVKAEEAAVREAIDALQSHFNADDICPVITYTAADDKPFKDQMKKVGQDAQVAKLQRPLDFTPSEVKPVLGWKDFAKGLVVSKGFKLQTTNSSELSVGKEQIAKAGIAFQLTKEIPNDQERSFTDKLTNKLPITAAGDLEEFDTIVKQASGAEKLAALKMDVDNLGSLFKDREREAYDQLSKGLSQFFEEELYWLTVDYIDQQKLYPLFAGGDDLFMIGTWDAILALAPAINDRFKVYQQHLHNALSSEQIPINLSAGIIIFSANYPMMRVNSQAEAALDQAKGRANKNSITIFGTALSWDEYQRTKCIAETLMDLINNHGESKSLLQKVSNSAIGYEKLQNKAEQGQLSFPKVWRLKYYLRDVQEQNKAIVEEQIFKQYEDALVKTYVDANNTNAMNPQLFPIAARWAELGLRSAETITEN